MTICFIEQLLVIVKVGGISVPLVHVQVLALRVREVFEMDFSFRYPPLLWSGLAGDTWAKINDVS